MSASLFESQGDKDQALPVIKHGEVMVRLPEGSCYNRRYAVLGKNTLLFFKNFKSAQKFRKYYWLQGKPNKGAKKYARGAVCLVGARVIEYIFTSKAVLSIKEKKREEMVPKCFTIENEKKKHYDICCDELEEKLEWISSINSECCRRANRVTLIQPKEIENIEKDIAKGPFKGLVDEPPVVCTPKSVGPPPDLDGPIVGGDDSGDDDGGQVPPPIEHDESVDIVEDDGGALGDDGGGDDGDE